MYENLRSADPREQVCGGPLCWLCLFRPSCELWAGFRRVDSSSAAQHSTAYPSTTTCTHHPLPKNRHIFAHHTYSALRQQHPASDRNTNNRIDIAPSPPPFHHAHLQSKSFNRKSLRLQPTLLARLTPTFCARAHSHPHIPRRHLRPMAQKDDNSPSSLWTRRSK